jgi:hypothetical protein
MRHPDRSLVSGSAAGLVMIAALATGASAQSPAAIESGARMRVFAGSGAPVTGRLVVWRSDSLIMIVDGAERAYASPSIVRMETPAGRRSQTWRGAKLGLVIGAVAGIVLGLADGDDPPENWFAMTAGDKAMAAGAGLGLLGIGIGAGVGAASRVEDWKPVDVPGPVPEVARARVRVGARIAF